MILNTQLQSRRSPLAFLVQDANKLNKRSEKVCSFLQLAIRDKLSWIIYFYSNLSLFILTTWGSFFFKYILLSKGLEKFHKWFYNFNQQKTPRLIYIQISWKIPRSMFQRIYVFFLRFRSRYDVVRLHEQHICFGSHPGVSAGEYLFLIHLIFEWKWVILCRGQNGLLNLRFTDDQSIFYSIKNKIGKIQHFFERRDRNGIFFFFSKSKSVNFSI